MAIAASKLGSLVAQEWDREETLVHRLRDCNRPRLSSVDAGFGG